MNELNSFIDEWKKINEEFLKFKKQKKQYEDLIFSELKNNHWKDYNHNKVHVSLVTKVNEYIDQIELPLLLSKSDIEKITRRNTVTKLVIVTDEMRNDYNKKLKGDKNR